MNKYVCLCIFWVKCATRTLAFPIRFGNKSSLNAAAIVWNWYYANFLFVLTTCSLLNIHPNWEENLHSYSLEEGGSSQPGSKKSRIRETKHLSTDADSNTDTTVGWTKNNKKTIFFQKLKKSSKTQKNQKCLEICQN